MIISAILQVIIRIRKGLMDYLSRKNVLNVFI